MAAPPAGTISWRARRPRKERHILRFILIAAVLFLAATAARAAPPDGTLLARAPCQPKQLDYATWLEAQEAEHAQETKFAAMHGVTLQPFDALRPKLLGETEFRRRRAYAGYACERLTYASDGLKVIAYLWRPQDVAGKHLPLIIFNRGGGQDLGKLVPWEHDGFFPYLEAGFAVIGTQYRGNDGGDGHDEEGGLEVRDIAHLVPLAHGLGFLDTDNLFMIGESRGAMMTYLAMQAGVTMKAAAVVGSETDLAANLKRRPELLEGYRKDTPGFATRPEAALRARSAQYWPEAISAPLLLMHGAKDWRVPPQQDVAFAARLEALRKPHELIIFDGDTHLLSFHRAERDARTIAWFKRHMAEGR